MWEEGGLKVKGKLFALAVIAARGRPLFQKPLLPRPILFFVLLFLNLYNIINES
jgi:hypothetical protein